MDLVRYIHLNPLRSMIVTHMDSLGTYPYGGHSALMGNMMIPWQDVDYVLSFYGESIRTARKNYQHHMERSAAAGRRPDLMGGGLIRSLGGWDEVKKGRIQIRKRIKGDTRILGDSEFASTVISDAKDHYSRRYALKLKGYNFERVVKRVSAIYGLERDYVLEKGRQKARVAARDLVCYWAVHELGVSLTDLAKRFDLSPSGISYAVSRGEMIAAENNYRLEEEVI